MTDKRYANFVAAFDFVAIRGRRLRRGTRFRRTFPKQFVANTGLTTIRPRAEYIKAEADYYKANIAKVKSIDNLIADKRLLRVAMAAYGLNADAEIRKRIREMLAGGMTDPRLPGQ